MWDHLEVSYQQLSLEGKEKVKAEAKMFGSDVKFRGFDGNRETEHMAAARILIDDLDGFTTFSERDLNSHMPLLPKYERMVEVYSTMRSEASGETLNAEQIIQILNA